ncbi:MAG: SRPBCC family protein [Nitrospirae bacterium]|nr:SRPBCC family protein [Nitrospirota bacterium]
MIIKNKIRMSAPPEKIWGFITDPMLMKIWNPRITAVVPITPGRPQANSQYRIRYKLAAKESNFLAEILEYEDSARIALHFSGGNLPKKGFIQEIYEVFPDSKGTLLKQTVLIEKSGMGIAGRLSLRIRNIMGASSGKRYLSRLRELAEGSS